MTKTEFKKLASGYFDRPLPSKGGYIFAMVLSGEEVSNMTQRNIARCYMVSTEYGNGAQSATSEAINEVLPDIQALPLATLYMAIKQGKKIHLLAPQLFTNNN